jgi:tetratricopeptide (TPR) repeat protein
MYNKALALSEELGRKEGMANNYGNLGNVYQTRGDLEQAEAAWKKSLALFQEIGVTPMVERVQSWLDALR